MHGRRPKLVAVALFLLLVAVALRVLSPTPNRTFSYGLDLCAQAATDPPIVLDAVVPRAFIGDPVEVLGTRVHSWIAKPPPSGNVFVAGYPPRETEIAYPLADVAGGVVSNPCGTDSLLEVIIGLRLTGDGWGGIDGVDVRYHVGDEHDVLTLDERYLVCAVADGCLAEAPTEDP